MVEHHSQAVEQLDVVLFFFFFTNTPIYIDISDDTSLCVSSSAVRRLSNRPTAAFIFFVISSLVVNNSVLLRDNILHAIYLFPDLHFHLLFTVRHHVLKSFQHLSVAFSHHSGKSSHHLIVIVLTDLTKLSVCLFDTNLGSDVCDRNISTTRHYNYLTSAIQCINVRIKYVIFTPRKELLWTGNVFSMEAIMDITWGACSDVTWAS